MLTSTSAVKIEACRSAFSHLGELKIIPVKVQSGVPEQPIGQETLTGAYNRIGAAEHAVPNADLYVSIENGVFPEGGRYVDRAVVVLKSPSKTEVAYSDGVEFPTASVDEARKRGFDKWTVGKVMQELGVVSKHDDPHLDLAGKSRSSYLTETVQQAAAHFLA